jgi:uncharacterized ferredoxin-like protein
MIRECYDAEMATIKQAADRMMTAAKTAPKASGVDDVVAMALTGEEKDALAEEMRRYGSLDERLAFFVRDAQNVDDSPVVVLFGAKDIRFGMGEACQLCGFQNCSENKDAGRLTSEEGARCVMPITDLGIAIGSAVTVAQEMRVDNRVMFSAGKAALNLGILGEDIRVAYGVPLYTGSKSIFRDRK